MFKYIKWVACGAFILLIVAHNFIIKNNKHTNTFVIHESWSMESNIELKSAMELLATPNPYAIDAVNQLSKNDSNFSIEQRRKDIYEAVKTLAMEPPVIDDNSTMLSKQIGSVDLFEILARTGCISTINELYNAGFILPPDNENEHISALGWLICGLKLDNSGLVDARTPLNKRNTLALKILEARTELSRGTLRGILLQSEMEGCDTLALYIVNHYNLTSDEKIAIFLTAYEMDNGYRLFATLLPEIATQKKAIETFIQRAVGRKNNSNDLNQKNNELNKYGYL